MTPDRVQIGKPINFAKTGPDPLRDMLWHGLIKLWGTRQAPDGPAGRTTGKTPNTGKGNTMFIEQYTEATGNVGTRGTGEVKYGKLHNNTANRVWIGKIPAGTYTRKEFVQAVIKACTNPATGNTIGDGAASNKVCSIFTSSGDWARKEFGITRSNNASKTEMITIGVKAKAAPAPAPAKAKAAPARKGKAKAKTVTQQSLPL